MKIGLLGAGQLGRMIALAGYPLGLRFRALDPSTDPSAAALTEWLQGDPNDRATLDAFADGLSIITYESENVELATATHLADTRPVFPPPRALEVSQERLREKRFFHDLGIPTAGFAAVDSEADLRAAVEEVGLPAVLKTRRFGYDGKGQAVLRRHEDIPMAWESLGGQPLLLEEYVEFDRELSVIAVRSRSGQVVTYPLVENHHRGGILRLSLAPAPRLTSELTDQAQRHAMTVLTSLDYAGVLVIEFFERDGVLLANEMAPRVHNSGHWTTEGAETSQFENHLRGILDWPLGSGEAVGHSAMVNLIGQVPDIVPLLGERDLHVHLYGKTPRPGRKLGHITVHAPDRERVLATLRHLAGSVPELAGPAYQRVLNATEQ